jgi:hypothetical protein
MSFPTDSAPEVVATTIAWLPVAFMPHRPRVLHSSGHPKREIVGACCVCILTVC